MSAPVVPTAIDLSSDRLRVQWADGVAELCAADLRAACRCGGCRAAMRLGHRPTPVPRLSLACAAPVGQYAVQLIFSDGHDRGIYPWDWLRELSGLGTGRAATD